VTKTSDEALRGGLAVNTVTIGMLAMVVGFIRDRIGLSRLCPVHAPSRLTMTRKI
jgi:hypothetical protein